MKERPILFNGPMVQAILTNRKSQTRRTAGLNYVNLQPDFWRITGQGALLGRWAATFERIDTGELHTAFCPYGQPGDRLWGRETWGMHFGKLLYRADFGPQSYEYDAKGWKSSIHMPRALSRLLFDLQGVRCERVQGITEADAQTEGVECGLSWSRVYPGTGAARIRESFREAFARLWNEINGKRGLGWAHNPWVWALSIQQVSA